MRPGTVRVLMYSHDTFGLGHLTRTLRIAGAIRERYEHTSILILTGSPVAAYLRVPDGTDLIKLPSVVKTGPDEYRARDLDVGFAQVKRIRRDLIRGAAEGLRPHLFMVDNVPLGMKSEVLPTLQFLRRENRGARIVLNLRDILDDPAVIRDHWHKNGVPRALDEFYDRIYVLGDDEVHDSVAAYGLPAAKTAHVGYAGPGPRRILTRSRRHRPVVLVTAGGGGDGVEFLHAAMDGLGPLVAAGPQREGAIRLEVVTGPLMNPEQRRLLHHKALEFQAGILEFVPDLPERMRSADLVVAMAGYNTCCEVLTHARAALLVPRVVPRVEQLLRARAFRERGLVSVLEPEDLRPDLIAAAARKALAHGPLITEAALPRMDGLGRLSTDLQALCPGLRGAAAAASTPAFGPAVSPAGHAPAALRSGFAPWYWPGEVAPTRPRAMRWR